MQLWWAVQATISAWSPQVLYRWRAPLLRLFDVKVGKNVVIRLLVKIAYLWKLILGDYAWVGGEVSLYILGEVAIGAYSMISQESYSCTGSHNHTSQHFIINATPIVIGEKYWLITDVFVAPGITISGSTVVGARNSVLKSLPANVVYRRDPAVVIRKRVETE